MTSTIFTMRHNRLFCSLVAAMLGILSLNNAPELLAQSGGSTYSSFNIGQLEQGRVGEAVGRAGIETPLPSRHGLNFGSSAGWSSLTYVSVQTGFSYEQYRNATGDLVANNNNTSIDHIAAAFPVADSLGLTIGIGFRPYSSVSYVAGSTIDIPSADTTVSGAAVYSGSGGISEAFAGFGIEPIDNVAIGAKLSALFGSSQRSSRLEFATPGFLSAGNIETMSVSGLGVTLSTLVEPVEGLRIGAALTTPITVEAKETRLGLYRVSRGDDTASFAETESEFTIPALIRAGLSWQTGRTVLATEVLMQNWSSVDRFSSTARDRMRVSLGAEYLPDDSPGSSGLERWTLRAGVMYDQSYVALDSEGVDALAVGLGASVPFAPTGILGSGATFDLGLELGSRSGAENSVDELSAKLTAGITVNEFWFR